MDETTVVVTGAGGGIGRAVVAAFAERGATVVASGRVDGDVEDVMADVDPGDGRIEVVTADVRDEFDVERLMEAAARRAGPIDVVVPCAAVFHGEVGESPLQETAYSAFDDTVRTNVRGVFAAVTEAVPHLAEDARVLVPSGAVAREPSEGMGAYAVSKAAVEGVARGFAADLAQAVGVVDPGVVATDLTGGQGRDPADVAGLFVWAADEADVDDLDGGVLDLETWKTESRRRDHGE